MSNSGIWYFDAHADSLSMSSFLKKDIRENDMQVDLLRAKEFSRYAQFFSIFDNGKGSSDISASYDRILSHIHSQLEKNTDLIIQCRNAHEADKLRSEERALSAQLDMAEDEEIISELQRRLMSVRNKILSLTGNA